MKSDAKSFFGPFSECFLDVVTSEGVHTSVYHRFQRDIHAAKPAEPGALTTPAREPTASASAIRRRRAQHLGCPPVLVHEARPPLRAAFFGDYPHELAGATKSLLSAVVDARDRGLLEPVVVLPAEGVVADVFREGGIEVRILRGSPAYDSFGKALLRLRMQQQVGVLLKEVVPYSRALARLLVEERAEVVHFNTARGVLLASLGAAIAGLPSVLHMRGTPRFERRYWVAAQAMSHRIIVVARALEADLLPSARARARVVYNGIADATRTRSREEARLALVHAGVVAPGVFREGPVFTSLSSVTPFKGLHHLLRAIAPLRETAKSATFLLAGPSASGPYPRWLKRQADELEIADRVLFLGFVRDPDLVLAASDALVLPSVERERLDLGETVIEIDGNEGLPRSILEAMRVGLPCIASDIAGTREQITDGTNGILVPPGDPKALATAIERLINEPGTRASMGARGREICRERFPIGRASDGLVDVLREARDTASAPAVFHDAFTTCLDAVRAIGR